jgi:nucleotide-binding universal stress UspA family protein
MSVPSTGPAVAIWDRVVCGIDGTPASLEAARQVARLMPASAQLTLCTVVDPDLPGGGRSAQQRLTDEAEATLEHARQQVTVFHRAEVALRQGRPIQQLLEELSGRHATLVAVGAQGRSRVAGIALGSVATAMLHEAPCSVFVGHGVTATDAAGGREVVIAFDGSDAARRALAVGRELTGRLLVKARVLVATGGAMISPELPELAADLGPQLPVTEDRRAPVDALVDASISSGPLILGSRHLSGVSALSSVSERVAHQARCPVLVVR